MSDEHEVVNLLPEGGQPTTRKLRVKWSVDESKGPKLKWYDGPRWKWQLFWRWLGYSHVWRGYLTNSGRPFKGRFVASTEDIVVSNMSEQIEKEIDEQILAGMSMAEDTERWNKK